MRKRGKQMIEFQRSEWWHIIGRMFSFVLWQSILLASLMSRPPETSLSKIIHLPLVNARELELPIIAEQES
jgi:hypothetical protein